MDPICHTLTGAALAEAGLKQRTRLGTLTLIAGANVPDVDVLIAGLGGVEALAFRRGWTHGVLAMAVLPVALALVVQFVDRLVPPRGGGRRARFGALVTLSAVAVASHYALDFLNTYGIRLLMPFSGRWFYGDALFIIDPWMWLVLAAGIGVSRWRIWRRRRDPHRPATPAHPSALLGVTLSASKGQGAPSRVEGRPARVALATAAVYAAVMLGAAALARHLVTRAVRAEGVRPVRVMAGPVFANPFRREVVLDMGTHYEMGELHWLLVPRFALLDDRIPKNNDTALVQAVASAPAARAFLTWSRFPYFVVQRGRGEARVQIGDMRFRRTPLRGWPSVTVRLPVE